MPPLIEFNSIQCKKYSPELDVEAIAVIPSNLNRERSLDIDSKSTELHARTSGAKANLDSPGLINSDALRAAFAAFRDSQSWPQISRLQAPLRGDFLDDQSTYFNAAGSFFSVLTVAGCGD
jgi:hypothetical protein